MGFKQFECREVHSEFAVIEVNRHEKLSDKMSYHFFELPKLPDVDSIDMTSEKDLWLALFNAETEEELEKLSASGGEVMSQAIEAYRGITATEEFKHLEILRARAGHDEAQAIRNAERRGAEAEQQKWQNVVAEKDAENERLRQELSELLSQRNNN